METTVNKSTIERAFALAKIEGIEITETNCLEFVKKALISEIEQVGKILDESRNEFGAGYKLINGMCKRTYLILSK